MRYYTKVDIVRRWGGPDSEGRALNDGKYIATDGWTVISVQLNDDYYILTLQKPVDSDDVLLQTRRSMDG